jgi:NCAIR mutase (PurE)-related protein
MDTRHLKGILEQVQAGKMDLEEALRQLRHLPFEDLGYAKIDKHRGVRTGVPEVIFCQGKSIEQIQGIVKRMSKDHVNVLATRAAPEVYDGVREVTADCEYHAMARLVVVNPRPVEKVGNIAVVSAGTADIPVAEEAAITAEVLENHVTRIYDVGVAGIHRVLDARKELFQANVAVVVAGMEGALASVVGGLVSCPVIGVPTSVGYGASFSGVSALLTMLNSCASGVSVVNIDNGFGAGYQASLINKIASRHGVAEKTMDEMPAQASKCLAHHSQ